MGVEGNRTASFNRQFSDFVAADKQFLFPAGDRFQRGRIDNAINSFDFAIRFLSGAVFVLAIALSSVLVWREPVRTGPGGEAVRLQGC